MISNMLKLKNEFKQMKTSELGRGYKWVRVFNDKDKCIETMLKVPRKTVKLEGCIPRHGTYFKKVKVVHAKKGIRFKIWMFKKQGLLKMSDRNDYLPIVDLW